MAYRGVSHAQGIYEYITKARNLADHRLLNHAWNIGCKVQKTNESKILSFGWVLDVMKCFTRWELKELLELLDNAMKYVIIEDRLLEALRMN